MNSKERFNHLLNLYLSEKISPEEQDEFFNLLTSNEFDAELESRVLGSLQSAAIPEADVIPAPVSEQMLREIFAADENNYMKTGRRKASRQFFLRISAAAAVLLAVTASLFLLLNKEPEQDYFVAQVEDLQHHQVNTTDSEQLLVLNDGSRITLHPGATFYYPANFTDTVREVYIEGDAFFEVASDSSKPFIVYSRHITTRVLGTSFLISMDAQNGVEEVSVKTGRVQVSENTRVLNKTEEVEPVIVTPNQKAVYETGKRVLVATLVNSPQVILVKEHQTQEVAVALPSFNYEQKKLSDIFQDLETAYGVEIQLENEELGNCLFTGDLSDNDLFTQLKIICLTTQSSYELKGTEILMKGQGCN